VVKGRSRMNIGNQERALGTGSLVFVEANQEHHFYDIMEDLVVLVFFAPAESN
jgi:quercetin dioxygenase-like cupin family protein